MLKNLTFKNLSFLLCFLTASSSANAVSEKFVVLTIDDGPHPGYTENIVEILLEEEITATFFLVGIMIDRHPDLVKKIYEGGFEIGNHTYNDIRMTSMASDEVVNALVSVCNSLERITGKRTSFFRPPGGRVNQLVLDTARQLGYYTVFWTRSTMDMAPGISPKQIYYHATRNPRDREIILLHSGVDATLQALRPIIEFYRNEGYSFKTVGDISVPVFDGVRTITRDSRFEWAYELKKQDTSDYPPLRGQHAQAGAVILIGAAAGTLLLIKISSGVSGRKSFSLAFIGGKKEEFKNISRVLNENGINAVFFVSHEDKTEIEKVGKKQTFAVLGKDGSIRDDIKSWKDKIVDGAEHFLPLYYREGGYSLSDIEEIKKEGFIPVDFRIQLPEKNPAGINDLLKYAEGNIGAGKTLPLRGDCRFTSKMLPELIEKIRQYNYNLVPIEKYVSKKVCQLEKK